MLKTLKGIRDAHSVTQYIEESSRLNEVYVLLELFWKQRCKQIWLKEGDRNSKYFHTMTKKRRKVNQITKLQNAKGNSVEWNNGLKDTMVEYFDTMFQLTST